MTDRISFEVNYSNIELDGAIKAQDGQSLLDRCAQTGHALACATITRTATGTVSAISNPLINIGGIETQAVDFTVNWTVPETTLGTFTVHSSTNFLLEFNELVPSSTGLVAIAREGTERGSPDQGLPEVKSTLSIDWDRDAFGATATARYISSIDEAGAVNTLDSVTYLDLQGRWTPAVLDDRITIALGINNVTDEDPPGCFTVTPTGCSLARRRGCLARRPDLFVPRSPSFSRCRLIRPTTSPWTIRAPERPRRNLP